ncbi:MAG: hypothetical protein K6E44_00285 [Bacteroidales bacterium]|nr:hypothetical protein [Bacteroidales bacterium]
MKRILMIAVSFVAGIQAFGQAIDFKHLVTKSPQEMHALYSNSEVITDDYYFYELRNEDFEIGYVKVYNALLGEGVEVGDFIIKTPNFCILSDYIEGGLKVGDSFERLQSFDFVNTPYGRGIPGNTLVQLDNNNLYLAYGEEYWQIYFIVKNGVITRIHFGSQQDIPSPNYSNPYSPFGGTGN